MTLTLPDGEEIVISAPDNSDKNCYVSSVSVDGRKSDRNYISMEQLRDGAHIRFEMSDRPDMSRGISDDAMPYSFSANMNL